MALAGTLGARLYMSETPLVDAEAVNDISDFTGLTIDKEITLIENVGEFGKQFELVTFQAVGDGRTRKLKGPYNAGTLPLVLGQDLSQESHLLLKTIGDSLDQLTYPFKLFINGADPDFDTFYFGGKVFSFRTVMGAANTVVKANVNIEIYTDVYVGFGDAS